MKEPYGWTRCGDYFSLAVESQGASSLPRITKSKCSAYRNFNILGMAYKAEGKIHQAF